MSVTSCLLLLLLCLSLHACNARPFAAADKTLEKKFHISDQNDQKEIAVTLKVESSSSNEREAAKENSIEETQLDDNNQKLKNLKARQKVLMDDQKAKTAGAAQKESLVSVSWPVPQKRRGEKHPGFNLDYSPPKTHPPSHN